jgi:UDP-N-acetyl-2-amino-2-deoxyglucuronate dehydrogenase
MSSFALTGAAGYIAPRHLRAIRDTGCTLVAACDPNDSVGILDSYSFDTSFFREFERFDRHLEKLRRKGEGIDYLSICSPNYLHDAHIRLALRLGADAICEKPLVLNPWNIDALEDLAQENGRAIYSILQLRLHPSLIALKRKVEAAGKDAKYDVNLTYVTARGRWYLVSWKGNVERSGGLATNIGIHLFDMLMWIFGPVVREEVHVAGSTTVAGFLELERADVRWFLSIDRQHLPTEVKQAGRNTYRSITVDGEGVEFSGGFTDLHTRAYEQILAGNGFSPEDCRPSIELAHRIRGAAALGVQPHSPAPLKG